MSVAVICAPLAFKSLSTFEILLVVFVMFLRTSASVIASRSACFVSTSAFLASRALSASVFAVLALSNAVCASRSPSLAVFKSFVAFVLSAVLFAIISF